MTKKAPLRERVIFDGALTIRNVASAQSRILDALHNHATIEIDCSAVTELDLSFVQLLLSAQKEAARRGKSLALAHPAAGPFRDVLARGGLLPDIGEAQGEEARFWLGGATAS